MLQITLYWIIGYLVAFELINLTIENFLLIILLKFILGIYDQAYQIVSVIDTELNQIA